MKGSLTKRLLLTALVILTAFLGLSGIALEAAFRESAETALQEKLTAYIYSLLASAEEDKSGKIQMPEMLSTPDFNQTDSGLIAQISGDQGLYQWHSASSLGQLRRFGQQIAHGQQRFRQIKNYQILDYGIAWEDIRGNAVEYSVSIALDRGVHEAEILAFRTSLWWWLGGGGTLLLLMQFLLIRWGLMPLRPLAEQINAIQQGRSDKLQGNFPAELTPLTQGLNALIQQSQVRQERIRNSLSDLAHSLKTPLTVLNGSINQLPDSEQKQVMGQEIQRINEIVSYQRQRAAVVGTSLITGPIALQTLIARITQSLDKAHADKAVHCDIRLTNDVSVTIDEGDCYELFGNLLDNAYKHCHSKVQIDHNKYAAHSISIEDDGKGIAQSEIERLLRRGERADQQHPGQGIGLAVVREIVRQYQWQLELTQSDLGGLCVIIRFQ